MLRLLCVGLVEVEGDECALLMVVGAGGNPWPNALKLVEAAEDVAVVLLAVAVAVGNEERLAGNKECGIQLVVVSELGSAADGGEFECVDDVITEMISSRSLLSSSLEREQRARGTNSGAFLFNLTDNAVSGIAGDSCDAEATSHAS